MKKTIIIQLFMLFTAMSIFAQSPNERDIFIDGNAPMPNQRTFFLDNFKSEAGSAGYNAVNDKTEAAYVFRFEVKPNYITWEDGSVEPAPPGEPQFVIQIFFIRNEDNTEVVSYDFPFTTLDEMYDYTQFLFLKAAVNIPVEDNKAPVDWQNKWVYLRLSIDFPITFYTLVKNSAPDQLYDGNSLWNGPDGDDWELATGPVYPLDNIVHALPALTVGVEFQFLSFMSLEANLHIGMESLSDLYDRFLGISLGAQLKFPLKLPALVLEPYLAFSYPIHDLFSSSIFKKHDDIIEYFPDYGFGGGAQIQFLGGRWGVLFVDLSYTYYFPTARIINHPDHHGAEFQYPETIDYRHSVIGLGLGYKIGLGSRKKK